MKIWVIMCNDFPAGATVVSKQAAEELKERLTAAHRDEMKRNSGRTDSIAMEYWCVYEFEDGGQHPSVPEEPDCWCPDEPGITTIGCPTHDKPKCPVCGELQHPYPSGMVCKNGHGF